MKDVKKVVSLIINSKSYTGEHDKADGQGCGVSLDLVLMYLRYPLCMAVEGLGACNPGSNCSNKFM